MKLTATAFTATAFLIILMLMGPAHAQNPWPVPYNSVDFVTNDGSSCFVRNDCAPGKGKSPLRTVCMQDPCFPPDKDPDSDAPDSPWPMPDDLAFFVPSDESNCVVRNDCAPGNSESSLRTAQMVPEDCRRLRLPECPDEGPVIGFQAFDESAAVENPPLVVAPRDLDGDGYPDCGCTGCIIEDTETGEIKIIV